MPADRASEPTDPPSMAFDWHPEPSLLRYTSEQEARGALEELGRATWGTALDYLFDEELPTEEPTRGRVAKAAQEAHRILMAK